MTHKSKRQPLIGLNGVQHACIDHGLEQFEVILRIKQLGFSRVQNDLFCEQNLSSDLSAPSGGVMVSASAML